MADKAPHKHFTFGYAGDPIWGASASAGGAGGGGLWAEGSQSYGPTASGALTATQVCAVRAIVHVPTRTYSGPAQTGLDVRSPASLAGGHACEGHLEPDIGTSGLPAGHSKELRFCTPCSPTSRP